MLSRYDTIPAPGHRPQEHLRLCRARDGDSSLNRKTIRSRARYPCCPSRIIPSIRLDPSPGDVGFQAPTWCDRATGYSVHTRDETISYEVRTRALGNYSRQGWGGAETGCSAAPGKSLNYFQVGPGRRHAGASRLLGRPWPWSGVARSSALTVTHVAWADDTWFLNDTQHGLDQMLTELAVDVRRRTRLVHHWEKCA